ncbi:hypothetical protein D4740_04135 [Actinomyces sp. 2119]|uniref:Uncharacterized protein n=1 Tax=Actinomyces lilanjuaniae TaxID=2321394 RepID=A0ABM6Z3F6_9ACTO|nr:hypothetical protein D5R93_04930 [Actinomyces lilanjuaniae]RJF43073.1 hypothetical protein D4740_04135 [Actinomyces sp. 2119]
MSQDGVSRQGCSCGCGGHGQPPEGTGAPDAPEQEAPAQPGSPAAIAQAVVSVLMQAEGSAGTPTTAAGQAAGVLPGRKAGNQLGLRDVSAAPSGGCGCGGGRAGHEEHRRSACGCGGH